MSNGFQNGYEAGARDANQSLGSFMLWCLVIFIIVPWLARGIYNLGVERGQEACQKVEKTSMEIRAK